MFFPLKCHQILRHDVEAERLDSEQDAQAAKGIRGRLFFLPPPADQAPRIW
jgi:hypothetical protein